MIGTLALFLSSTERMCCRFVSEDKPMPYHPGLLIQGILKVQFLPKHWQIIAPGTIT